MTQSDTLNIYIFGKQSVTLDTLEIKPRVSNIMAYDLDTIDLMLLKIACKALAYLSLAAKGPLSKLAYVDGGGN